VQTSRVVGQQTRESVNELRAVAALVVTGRPVPLLVGPCALVTTGSRTVAFSSAELLRAAGEPLAIALTFDHRVLIPVTAWSMSRSPAMGLVDVSSAFPAGEPIDVVPLSIAGVNASVDTRGAHAALVTVQHDAERWSRRIVPVHVDTLDDSSDDHARCLASPVEPDDVDAAIDGAALVAWMAADPVLGRPAEVLMTALATPYRQRVLRPRALPAIAELSGLDDLGRVLPWRGAAVQPASNELAQIAGEIEDLDSGPVGISGRKKQTDVP